MPVWLQCVFEKPTSMVNICPATSPTLEVFSPFFNKVGAYFSAESDTPGWSCSRNVHESIKAFLERRLFGAVIRGISTCCRLLL